MAIAFVGAATNTGTTDNATTWSVTKHASTAAGHLMIHVFVGAVDTRDVPTVTLTGWTPLGFYQSMADGTSTPFYRSYWFYRIMQGGDTSWTGTTDKTFDSYAAATVSYSGCNSVRPIERIMHKHGHTGAATTLTTPFIRNMRENQWWVAWFGATQSASGAITWSASTGSERVDIDAGDSATDSDLAIYDSNGPVTAGTSISVTGTRSTGINDRMSAICSLRPAP